MPTLTSNVVQGKDLKINFEDDYYETSIKKYFEKWAAIMNEPNKGLKGIKVGNNYIITRALLKNIKYKNNYYHVADKKFRSRRLARVYVKHNLNYYIQNIEFIPDKPAHYVNLNFTVDYSGNLIQKL